MTRSWLAYFTPVMEGSTLAVFLFTLSRHSLWILSWLWMLKLCKLLALIYMQISLMCCLGSKRRNYSGNLRAHCSWPRWLHLGKVKVGKVFSAVLWTWSLRELLVTVDQLAIQYDWPRQEIFKLLMHGWRRGDGSTSKHQDVECSCMLTWQPRSGVAKWLLPIQSLRIKVGIDLMLRISDSFSPTCYSWTANFISLIGEPMQQSASFIGAICLLNIKLANTLFTPVTHCLVDFLMKRFNCMSSTTLQE